MSVKYTQPKNYQLSVTYVHNINIGFLIKSVQFWMHSKAYNTIKKMSEATWTDSLVVCGNTDIALCGYNTPFSIFNNQNNVKGYPFLEAAHTYGELVDNYIGPFLSKF